MKSPCFSYFIKSTKALRILASVSVFGILLLSSFVINPIYIYIYIYKAEGTTGTATESTTSLTLASTATDTSIVLTPGAGFTLSTSSNTSSYDVITNNYTGYTITLTSEDNDKTLVHTVDNTKVISSINTPIAETDFVSTTSGLMNHFGIKPNKYYDTENNTTIDNTVSSTILPAPGTTGLILDKTTTANSTANNYSIALGAMVDGTIPAGDYTRDLELVAIANPVAYRVIFNKNTNDTVSNMPTEYSGSTSTTGINIPNTIPERTGYTFAGWCNRKDTLNTCPTGGTTYQPNGVYGIDQTSQNEVTLYAIWQPNYYMQDVAIWGKTLVIGQSMQAIDRRDNKIYWVTKEETDPSNPRAEIDETTGKAFQIWMTQNLDLDLDSTRTYTHADTDLGYTTNNALATWQPIRSTMTDISNWVDDDYTPYSYRDGAKYYFTSNDSNSDTVYNSLISCTEAQNLAEECMHYLGGNYYNWSSAVANNSTSSITSDYTQMPDSICPAGWRLPTGLTTANGYGDYGYLFSANEITVTGSYGALNELVEYRSGGFNNVRKTPLWIVRQGYAESGVTGGVGVAALYWTGTAVNSFRGYVSDVSLNGIRPAAYNVRRDGVSIRCVARPEKTMQTVATWQDELTIGDSVQAVDLRDNKIYWVTKEETDAANPRAYVDSTTGKSYQIWMTQNLDYNLNTTKTLTPSTSDVSANWTPARDTITPGNLDSTTWLMDGNTPYSYDDGNVYYYTSGSNDTSVSTNVDTKYTSLSDCAAAHDSVNCSHYHAGNYYNWAAAVADNNTTNIGSNYAEMPDSICPAGWRLPTGPSVNDSYGDYGGLFTKNGVMPAGQYSGYATNGLNTLRAEPLWFVRPGYIEDVATLVWGGVSANYRTGSTYSSTESYHVGLDSRNIGVIANGASVRAYGFSVRCIARAIINDLSTMQEFANLDKKEKDNVIKSMVTGEQYELRDVRDNQTYTIAKLADGTVWMTKNLNIAGGTTLTPDTTNISSNYTLPASSMGGFSDPAVAYVYNSNSETCGNDSPCYSYYSYAAATAGTNPTSGNAAYDICPKGWKLPTIGDFDFIKSTYWNGGLITSEPFNGTGSGGYEGGIGSGTFSGGGTNGGYWASGARSTTAWGLFYSGGVSKVAVDKAAGTPIRCILDNTSIEDIATMQDFDSLTPIQRKNVLQSMVAGVSYTVTDSRDNESYSIAKLADNQVWLRDNLRLDLTNATVKDNLSSSNTNASDASLGYLKNGGGTTSDQYATAGVANWTSGSSYSAPLVNAADKDTVPANGYAGKNGVYYNFCATSAGSYCYGNGADAGTSYGDALEDICPKGWRLPTGGTNGEYQTLFAAYSNSYADIMNALHAPLSGTFNNGAPSVQGQYVNLWSSTKANDERIHLIYVYYATSGDPSGSNTRNIGNNIRCVLNTSMQDVTSDTLGELIPNNGDVITVSDKRDNEKYAIGRLADGRVWLLENLRLGGTSAINLTPNDTNVTASWSLPASITTGFNSYSVAQINVDSKNTLQSHGDGNSKVGVYYNYCSASAGTICVDNNTSDATVDICPKGWRMPTGGTDGEYQTLYNAYNAVATLQNTFHATQSGGYYNDRAYGQGSYGSFWSSTRYDDGYMYDLTTDSTGLGPQSYADRYYGNSVRCIKSN